MPERIDAWPLLATVPHPLYSSGTATAHDPSSQRGIELKAIAKPEELKLSELTVSAGNI
jgi:hypothetical protein